MTTSDYTPDIIQIHTRHGFISIIDVIDHDLSLLKWTAVKDRNTTYIRRGNNIRIHQIILSRMLGRELLPNEKVDHIDGDGLNNRRNNLRLATHMQNMANQRLRKNNTSGFKGVVKDGNRYRARIGFKNRDIHIGLYPTPELAALAYDQKAKELFGEFANLNF